MVQIKTGYSLQTDAAYYEKKFNVTWIGPPKDVKVSFTEKNPVSQRIQLELSLRNDEGEDLEWFDSVAIEWSVTGSDDETNAVASSLNETSAFINGNDNHLFIIDRNVLYVGGTYQVYMTLFAKDYDNVWVEEAVSVIQTIAGPQGGTLSIDVSQGDSALQYLFTLTTSGWEGETFEDGSLQY
jgi:hypothetical protein